MEDIKVIIEKNAKGKQSANCSKYSRNVSQALVSRKNSLTNQRVGSRTFPE